MPLRHQDTKNYIFGFSTSCLSALVAGFISPHTKIIVKSRDL
jgi:hypothetical protein